MRLATRVYADRWSAEEVCYRSAQRGIDRTKRYREAEPASGPGEAAFCSYESGYEVRKVNIRLHGSSANDRARVLGRAHGIRRPSRLIALHGCRASGRIRGVPPSSDRIGHAW